MARNGLEKASGLNRATVKREFYTQIRGFLYAINHARSTLVLSSCFRRIF